MKDKELSKKALWAYGNYGVNGICRNGSIIKLSSSNFDTFLNDCLLGDCSLLIYPIECLIEEIEHPVTGEKFIPIERLYNDKLDAMSIESMHGAYSLGQSLSDLQKLAEWHIDYMGLIPKGIGVDKRVVNPYSIAYEFCPKCKSTDVWEISDHYNKCSNCKFEYIG